MWTTRWIYSVYRPWQGWEPHLWPLLHNPSRPPSKHDPSLPLEPDRSLRPLPCVRRPADHDPSRPPGHVPSPPPPPPPPQSRRVEPPCQPVDVQAQARPPPRRLWLRPAHVLESLANNRETLFRFIPSAFRWGWRWWGRWPTEGITAVVGFIEWGCSTACQRKAYLNYHAYEYGHHGPWRRWRETLCTLYLDPNVQSKSTTTTPRTWTWPWQSAWTWSTIVKKDIKTALPRRVVWQMIKHGTQTQTTGC